MYFAMVFLIKTLRYYMLGNTTYVIAQADPLRYLMSKSYLSGRSAKWIMFLQEFDLVFVTQKLIKGQAIVDFIENYPRNDTSIVQDDFLYEVSNNPLDKPNNVS